MCNITHKTHLHFVGIQAKPHNPKPPIGLRDGTRNQLVVGHTPNGYRSRTDRLACIGIDNGTMHHTEAISVGILGVYRQGAITQNKKKASEITHGEV